MEGYLLISDAAKEVHVESHVLRYWEEELHLPIKRNELGHRYYTKEDVERFKQIKSMKERGLQLKAIKMILRDGKIDVMLPEQEKEELRKKELEKEKEDLKKENLKKEDSKREGLEKEEYKRRETFVEEENKITADTVQTPEKDKMAIEIVDSPESTIKQETKEEKARRLQWLLQQLIRETLQENNKELCRDIRESVIKELDYQFRNQEEREEERYHIQELRNEEYYKRIDELLRRKSRFHRGKRKELKLKEEKQKIQRNAGSSKEGTLEKLQEEEEKEEAKINKRKEAKSKEQTARKKRKEIEKRQRAIIREKRKEKRKRHSFL